METGASWVDTHAHLFADEFAHDLPEVLTRARDAGVRAIILPNIDCESVLPLQRIVDAYPHLCYGAMGLHPTSVRPNWKSQIEMIERALKIPPGVGAHVAIGEIGLDYHWDTTFISEQKEAFLYQLRWAITHRLPAIIHARDSMDDVLEILAAPEFRSIRCVLHAFTGNVAQASRAMELPNVYVGLGGICTFPRGLDEAVYRVIRPERVLLETDAPYLSPAPKRGKRNESARIPLIAAVVAERIGVDIHTLSMRSTSNAIELFALPYVA